MDMHVYLTTKNDGFTRWSSPYKQHKDQDLANFVWKNITYGDYSDHRSIDFEIKFPTVSPGSMVVPIRSAYLALVCSQQRDSMG